MDVTRATNTSLDVMLEKLSTFIGLLMEIESCQIRGQASLGSRNWMKNHRMDIHGPGRETDKKRNDIQTRLSVARNLERHVRSVEAKKKRKWALEKKKLDNARKLRGIYLIDPADEEFKDILKNACEKVGSSDGSVLDTRETKYACASLKPTILRESVWKEPFIKAWISYCRERN